MKAPWRERLMVVGTLGLIAAVQAILLFHNTPTTHRYDELADAFEHQQTCRLANPSPKLLALKDPFDALENEPYREHDLVLFHDRFYFYWGPAPAALITPIKLLFPGARVSDAVIAWVFAQGLMLALAITLSVIRRRWFDRASITPLIASLLGAGLATPMPFLFARPSIYEAAILGGQCFLMLAVAFWIVCITSARPSGWRLLAAGTCAALAIASRLSLAPAIAILCLLALIELRRRHPCAPLSAWMREAFLLGAPLVLLGAALAAYNYARFGSFSESGIRYMLASRTGRAALDQHEVFSGRYLIANSINYLFAPARLSATPPFLRPGSGVAFKHPPHYYHADLVAGVVATTPWLCLALIPILLGLKAAVSRPVAWASIALAALAGASLIAPLFCFYYCSMRYLADFTPALALLAGVSLWQVRSRWFHGFAAVLLVVSCCIGVLLAMTGYAAT